MGKIIDITGKRFGRLVAIEIVGRNTGNNILWKCKCDCGSQIITTGTLLRSGMTQSCGCLRRESVTKSNRRGCVGKIKIEESPEIAFARPVNKDEFTDWWMFGEKDYMNELWFNKHVV